MRILLLLLLTISNIGFAQSNTNIGLSGTYNLALKTSGIGVRYDYRLARRLSVNAQAQYYPSFNAIHELNARAYANIYVVTPKQKVYFTSSQPKLNPSIYVTVGTAFNYWLNYYASINPNASQTNIIPQIGIGSSIEVNQVQFFAESKYITIFNESNIEIGILFNPFQKSTRRGTECPRY